MIGLMFGGGGIAALGGYLVERFPAYSVPSFILLYTGIGIMVTPIVLYWYGRLAGKRRPYPGRAAFWVAFFGSGAGGDGGDSGDSGGA